MKKLICLILSILMLVSCTAFVSAAEEPKYENDAKVAIIFDEATLNADGNYVLPVNMFFDSSVTAITGATLVIDYDETKLTYVTGKKKSLFIYNDDEEFESDYDSIDINSNGDIVASFSAEAGYSIEGKLLQLQFTPIAGVTGSAEFKILPSSGNATTMYVLPDGSENGKWQANTTAIPFTSDDEEEGKIEYVLGEATLNADGNYVLPISMLFKAPVTTITGATLVVDYDETKLTYVTGKKKSLFIYNDDEEFESDYDSIDINSNGDIVASFSAEAGYSIEGVLLQLQFTPIAGATGSAEFKILPSSGNATTMYVLPDGSENGKWEANSTSITFTSETQSYDVTFDANLEGVVSPDAITGVEEGKEIDLPVLDNTADYTFRGWKVNGEGESLTGKYTVTANTAFVADWEKIEKYTVTFTTEHGTAPESIKDVVAGTKITLGKLDDTADFLFGGWTDGENDFDAGEEYEVTSDVTFAAIWNKIEKYTVTFATDHGTAPAPVENLVAGAEIPLEKLDDTADYTFGGWSDGKETYTDKYKVTGDITLTAVWNVIVKYTVTFSEGGFEPITVVAGESVEVPELTHEELSFKGWKVGDTTEIVAGGATFVPTSSVLLTPVWGGAKKLYIDTTGDDANDGLTKENPIKTLKRAQEILLADAKADNTLDTIVVVEKYEKKNESSAATDNFCKGLGKKLYITGLTPESIFDMTYYDASNSKVDSHFRIATDIEFNNITFVGSTKDGGPNAMGYELTFGENIIASNTQGIAAAHYNNIYKDGSIINVNSGAWGRVHYAGMSGAKVYGVTTTNINGGNVSGIFNGHGCRNNNIAYGANYINVNGGNVGQINLHAVGIQSVTSYAGLRYFTINDGTVGNVTTTGKKQVTYKDGDVTKEINSTIRDGVTVFEINGGTVGKFATSGEEDAATRVIINNAGAELTVEDTGMIVLNVMNGKLHAETTGFDEAGKPTYTWSMSNNAVLDWAKTVELTGFSYELAEGADFNAVMVGDMIYRLEDLENNLIPAPAAGTYDVTFIKVYELTINGVVSPVIAGDSVELTRLPKDGDLKHIGWTTVEGGTTAEINHTTTYTPTGDVTLYPVWAAAVYFTATFETAHGTAPEAISIIDDDEDGKADEAMTFPGYEGKLDEHFTFVKWTAKDNAEVSYNAGETLVLEGNIVFVAEWVEDPKAYVTYRNESGEAPESFEEYIGTEITITECPAVEGFEFLGWVDGTEIYQPGDKVVLTENGLTFTAKWGVKVAVDVNGAKGEAPVIGGAIGEEIDLPTEVELTKVNNRFVGFALSADGEVITGKYTVNPEDTLYVIWEEVVADAAIIETAVTYYTGTGSYLVDVYMYGKDANTVAFGYAFGENLEFVGFAPAEGLNIPDVSLEKVSDGYFATVVADEIDSKIEGADATEGNGVHLGTITFTFKGTKEDYAEDDAADNIALTLPAEVIDNVSSAKYFLYVPAEGELSVIGLPVVFDEAIAVEIIDIVYPVLGSFSVVRDDENAPRNFATITALNSDNKVIKTFAVEDAETVAVDGVVEYAIELPEGEYTLVLNKTGYLEATTKVVIVAQEGAEEEGFEPEAIEVGHVDLIAGDLVAEYGVIDLLDFAAITSSFGIGELDEAIEIALDIDENGEVNVYDLAFIKYNFGARIN